jgi:hypothetical protein
VPNKDISGFGDNTAERKKTKTMPKPDKSKGDFGKEIFPSKNLAIAQKTKHKVSPTTKSSPLEVSIGMFVKGKQKRGNKTTTSNNHKNDSLSNNFEFI